MPKQENKAKQPNHGLKRPLQIEQEEINEAKTREELEKVTGQSDPLNLVLVTLTRSSRKSRIKLEKTRIRNQLRKTKMQVETIKQKGLQHEFNTDIIEDLQEIIDNISDEQDPVSTSLKAVISKLKKRIKLIKIADSTEGAGQL